MKRICCALLLLAVVLIGCSSSQDTPPKEGSYAASSLDGDEKELKQFLSVPEHYVVGLKPKRQANLVALIYSKPHQGAYATCITEMDEKNAFAEEIIIKLPKEETAKNDFLTSVKSFFTTRQYPEDCVTVDKDDPRFACISANPTGSVMSIRSDDDP